MADIDDIEFKISKMDLGPNDILVIRSERLLPREVVARMHEVCSQMLKDRKVLILDGGLDLAILTVSEIESRTAVL